MNLFGGVELGGTKVICAVGTGPRDIRELDWFPTENPEATIQRIIQFFHGQDAMGHL